ncbi:MAG: hypothetical protein GXP08_15080 [Gammaproteobacteria bacterium]|nr:hypothetical protein [Gammaproteobacteria bacterium]
MLRTLKLLLPALFPSWRFFDTIAPSPRVQFALLNAKNEASRHWHEFRPRPARLSLIQTLGRMLWNPAWNESLFLVSCAERLMEQPTQHSEDEILKRIMDELKGDTSKPREAATHLQFRLLLVYRQGTQLQQKVTFHSRIQALSARHTA